MYNRTHAPVHFGNLMEGFMKNDLGKVFYDNYRNDHFAQVNIREAADHYELQLAAPGWNKEDFKLSVDKNILTIGADHKEEQKEAGKDENKQQWIRQEFKTRSFKRSFTLNEKVDVAAIQAHYENGILLVNLPKKEKEEVKTVAISVQ